MAASTPHAVACLVLYTYFRNGLGARLDVVVGFAVDGEDDGWILKTPQEPRGPHQPRTAISIPARNPHPSSCMRHCRNCAGRTIAKAIGNITPSAPPSVFPVFAVVDVSEDEIQADELHVCGVCIRSRCGPASIERSFRRPG